MTLGGVGLSEGSGSFEGSKPERRLRRAGSIPALSTSFGGPGWPVRTRGNRAPSPPPDIMLRHYGKKADTLRKGFGMERPGLGGFESLPRHTFLWVVQTIEVGSQPLREIMQKTGSNPCATHLIEQPVKPLQG